MNPTEQLELMNAFVVEVERLHRESLTAGMSEELEQYDLEIAMAARRFAARIIA